MKYLTYLIYIILWEGAVITVTLDGTTVRKAKRIGAGNLSAGIRTAVQRHK